MNAQAGISTLVLILILLGCGGSPKPSASDVIKEFEGLSNEQKEKCESWLLQRYRVGIEGMTVQQAKSNDGQDVYVRKWTNAVELTGDRVNPRDLGYGPVGHLVIVRKSKGDSTQWEIKAVPID